MIDDDTIVQESQLSPNQKESNKQDSEDSGVLSARRSMRHKKPSSKWIEEAGYMALSPRSTKIKRDGSTSGTPEAPEAKEARLDNLAAIAKRSLKFLEKQSEQGKE